MSVGTQSGSTARSDRPLLVRPDLPGVSRPSDSRPDVSVIIMSWRGPEALARCLAGIESQDCERPLGIEIVVVDSSEDGETWKLLQGRAELTRLRE